MVLLKFIWFVGKFVFRVPTSLPFDRYHQDSPGSPKPHLSPYNRPHTTPPSPYETSLHGSIQQPSPHSSIQQPSPYHSPVPPSPYQSTPPPSTPITSHRYNTPLSMSHTSPMVPPYHTMDTPPTSSPLVPPTPADIEQTGGVATMSPQPTVQQTSMLSFSSTDYEEVRMLF